MATDDPEGASVYQSLLDYQDERILVLSHQDTALVNALQRKAAVVIQKSIREGFGPTVAEAMWKGNPVIGGNVGGIRLQIQEGVNGFLVNTPDEAAERIVQLIRDKTLRSGIGGPALKKPQAQGWVVIVGMGIILLFAAQVLISLSIV